MPSLFRYFMFVGGGLLGLLLLINHLYGEPPVAPDRAAQAKVVVQHHPRASLIERWRDEQEARKAAERGEPAPVIQAMVDEEPPQPAMAPSPAQPEIPDVVAPAALKTAPTVDDADARHRAEQAKAAKLRKARLARERAERQRAEDERREQGQFFGFAPSRATYADAQRRSSPFGWNW